MSLDFFSQMNSLFNSRSFGFLVTNSKMKFYVQFKFIIENTNENKNKNNVK